MAFFAKSLNQPENMLDCVIWNRIGALNVITARQPEKFSQILVLLKISKSGYIPSVKQFLSIFIGKISCRLRLSEWYLRALKSPKIDLKTRFWIPVKVY